MDVDHVQGRHLADGIDDFDQLLAGEAEGFQVVLLAREDDACRAGYPRL